MCVHVLYEFLLFSYLKRDFCWKSYETAVVDNEIMGTASCKTGNLRNDTCKICEVMCVNMGTGHMTSGQMHCVHGKISVCRYRHSYIIT